MKVRLALLFIIILLGLEVALAAPRTLVVRDASGRKVEVRVPVRRAVFLIGYELIPYLDLWDQTVGISLWAKRYSDLLKEVGAERLKEIPSVGTATQANLEALALFSPDLIVTWTYRPETLKVLEEFGQRNQTAIIAISPESLKDLRSTMRLLAELFGKEERLLRVNRAMEEVFSLIDKRLSDLRENEKKRVLWLWGDHCHCQVAGGRGVVADILRLAGGKNCAEALDHPYPRVSPERIVLWDPEVIFIWGNASYGAEDILQDRRLAAVAAVKHGAVYKAPAWSTWSPRVALITLWVAMKIYPERFRGISFKTLVERFNRNAI
ncbi:ABC transporter substrate-binding protein [Thermosulfurimonas dismutans]|uniref:Iron(III) ABC transporter, periplasmic iron-binding protein (CeuE) n=1 Tax=Thermosulfurimonas dismutans TaxID=999894 RepID=A0A179D236_9BACT|nr:ABC transporter substrate-binding protein [Thermosulfurimonas dismutans]OAQ20053.1 iron(III) ABC transporter, periplasmic iron-binding protein (ceuE) [Thermosulfurimonas dismutans]